MDDSPVGQLTTIEQDQVRRYDFWFRSPRAGEEGVGACAHGDDDVEGGDVDVGDGDDDIR